SGPKAPHRPKAAHGSPPEAYSPPSSCVLLTLADEIAPRLVRIAHQPHPKDAGALAEPLAGRDIAAKPHPDTVRDSRPVGGGLLGNHRRNRLDPRPERGRNRPVDNRTALPVRHRLRHLKVEPRRH